MEYRCEYVKLGGEVHSKSISEAQYGEIKIATQQLQEFTSEMDYFCMVVDNIEDYLRECSFDRNDTKDKFIQGNRYLANWLNSFYMWIEYHERHMKAQFANLKKKYYDQYSAYRMAYNLRKYMTHCSLAFTKSVYDVIHETMYFNGVISEILERGLGFAAGSFLCAKKGRFIVLWK